MIVETSFGPVPVTGRVEQPDKPLLFVIRGAGGTPRQMAWVPYYLPGDVALLSLPGAYAPLFERNSISDFAAAFDQVLSILDRPAVAVLGVSLGGLAAMAMRHPSIRQLILLDTPLTTDRLWPLQVVYREAIIASPVLARWMDDLLGVRLEGCVRRDYGPLLAELRVPTTVLLASDPLEPERAFERVPSLVGDSDRALYRAHPLVRSLTVANTGHDIGFTGPRVLMDCLHWAMRKVNESAAA